jgi:DNA repair ATPase RecN
MYLSARPFKETSKPNSMKFIAILFLIAAVAAGCGQKAPAKTAEDIRNEEHRRLEGKNPFAYLSGDHIIIRRDQGRKPTESATITGEIVSTTNLARFKDILIDVSFFSKKDSLLTKNSYVVYDSIDATSRKRFSIKVADVPAVYKNFLFQVMGATAMD